MNHTRGGWPETQGERSFFQRGPSADATRSSSSFQGIHSYRNPVQLGDICLSRRVEQIRRVEHCGFPEIKTWENCGKAEGAAWKNFP